MFRPLTTGLILALFPAALAVAPAAGAALITFDSVTNSQVMPGETIGSTAEVAVTYDGDLLGWANAGGYFPDGASASGGAIYNTTADGVGTVIFTAVSGYEVRVDSLVLRAMINPTSAALLEFSLDEGANWTEVPTAVAVGAAGQIDFTGVQASVVHVRFSDSLDGGTTQSDAGIDNIDFSAVQVPEPGSLALLGLGGLMVMRRRRA